MSADFLSRVEAAKKLSVSVKHLDNMIRRGQLKAVRAGRRVLVPTAALSDLPRA